jgi:hypothetical protein
MHYLPLTMHGDTAVNSIKSPFYYYFDGRDMAVCFCVDKEFVLHQLENTRAQHFTDDKNSEIEWGLGYLEFCSVEQIMLFVEKWDVRVATHLGLKSPTALALWTSDPNESHRIITFNHIREKILSNKDSE